MKKNHISLYLLVAFLVLTGAYGCKKYLDDAYLDPNRPVNPNVQTTLGPIANNWARGVFFDSRFIGKYIQNFSDASGLANVGGVPSIHCIDKASCLI